MSSYDTSSGTPCSLACLEDQVVQQNCTPTGSIRCAKQCNSKGKYVPCFLACHYSFAFLKFNVVDRNISISTDNVLFKFVQLA